MKVQDRESDWKKLENYAIRAGRNLKSLSPDELEEFLELYRDAATDLGIMNRKKISRDVRNYLNTLLTSAHNVFYRGVGTSKFTLIEFFLVTLPVTVRKNWRLILITSLTFFLTFSIFFGYSRAHPEFVDKYMPYKQQLEPLAEAYKEGFEEGRGEGMDAQMTAFYIQNNIGIAFRMFAGGIIFSLGTFFFLLFNGASIGMSFGYIANAGGLENLIAFVSTHFIWEIGGLIISGAAGLKIGFALAMPGERTRADSLKESGAEAITLVTAAFIMIFFAAFIEGFYSSSSLPNETKLLSGLLGTVAVLSYFILAGRK